MPIYVTLWRYTRDGLMDIGNTEKRFGAVKKIIEKQGGKLLQIYGLVGEYDVITVVEMPNKSALATAVFKICSSGRITAKTLSALPIEEFLSITKEI